MAKTTMEITLSDELKQRLEAVAVQQGKSVNVVAQEALYIHVEDVEDGAMSDVALKEEGLTYFSAEREKQRGLDRALLETSRAAA